MGSDGESEALTDSSAGRDLGGDLAMQPAAQFALDERQADRGKQPNDDFAGNSLKAKKTPRTHPGIKPPDESTLVESADTSHPSDTSPDEIPTPDTIVPGDLKHEGVDQPAAQTLLELSTAEPPEVVADGDIARRNASENDPPHSDSDSTPMEAEYRGSAESSEGEATENHCDSDQESDQPEQEGCAEAVPDVEEDTRKIRGPTSDTDAWEQAGFSGPGLDMPEGDSDDGHVVRAHARPLRNASSSNDDSSGTTDIEKLRRRTLTDWHSNPRGQYPVDFESDLSDSLVDINEVYVAPPRVPKPKRRRKKTQGNSRKKQNKNGLSDSSSGSDLDDDEDLKPSATLDVSDDNSETQGQNRKRNTGKHLQNGSSERTEGQAERKGPKRRKKAKGLTKAARKALLVESIRVTIHEPVQWKVKHEVSEEEDIDNVLGELAAQVASRKRKPNVKHDAEVLAAAVAVGPPRLYSYENNQSGSDESDDDMGGNLVVLPPVTKPNTLELRKSLKEDLHARIVHRSASLHYSPDQDLDGCDESGVDEDRVCNANTDQPALNSGQPSLLDSTKKSESSCSDVDYGSARQLCVPKRPANFALGESEAEESGTGVTSEEDLPMEEEAAGEMKDFLTDKSRVADISKIRACQNIQAKKSDLQPIQELVHEESEDKQNSESDLASSKKQLHETVLAPNAGFPNVVDEDSTKKPVEEGTDDEEANIRRAKAKRLWKARRKREIASCLGLDSGSEEESAKQFQTVENCKKRRRPKGRNAASKSHLVDRQNHAGLKVWTAGQDFESHGPSREKSTNDFGSFGRSTVRRGGFAAFTKITAVEKVADAPLPIASILQAPRVSSKTTRGPVPSAFNGLFAALNSRCTRAS